jgi:hypothetical protein
MKFAVAVFSSLFASAILAVALGSRAGAGPYRQSITATVGQSKLDRQIPDFRTSGRTMMTTIIDIAFEFQLPMGIEYVDREAITRPLYLEFHDQSIRSILRGIIAQGPAYRISFSGEVVQIDSPKSLQDPSNPFNRSIQDFSVTDVDTRNADLTLVCELGKDLGPQTFCGGSIATGQWGPRLITLHLQNSKVYEILDAIVHENGQAIWIVMAPDSKLPQTKAGALWHIYPLRAPFQATVLDKLTNLVP